MMYNLHKTVESPNVVTGIIVKLSGKIIIEQCRSFIDSDSSVPIYNEALYCKTLGAVAKVHA